MQARKRLPSSGTASVIRPSMTWKLCTTAPILAYADFTKPFKLHTDASRSLSKAESHYPAHKLEFPTLKWVVLKNSINTCMGWPLTSIWTIIPNLHFQLHYRAGKANIDADALSRVSWLGCMPDNSGTHLKSHSCSSVSCARGYPRRPCKSYWGLHLWSAHSGCSLGQPAGHLYDLEGLASSPASRSYSKSGHL